MTEHTHGSDILDALKPLSLEMRRHIPEVTKAYAALSGAVMGEGALDRKTKELIALAISISLRCDGCIASHARAAARRGATEAEVAEAIGVAILMNGGPATVWGPRALAAFQEHVKPE